jgi:ubiquinone/menaquinone biosynthesis C-methylase UbiE
MKDSGISKGTTMKKRIYRAPLDRLKRVMGQYENTPFYMWAKVVTLTTMNMRYEKIAFNLGLKTHPYLLTKGIILDALLQFQALADTGFIESEQKELGRGKSTQIEKKHLELFDEMWDKYNPAEFERYVERYRLRIRINNLTELVRGKSCIDLGCGNGAFCFALIDEGAGFATGIDFGAKNIQYAQRIAEHRGLKAKTEFHCRTVYETGFRDGSFDFAIQNGVFHHLNDLDKALRETRRILSQGGWFWYYTDGEGGISYDLWDASVEILKDVPVLFIQDVLGGMNVSADKIVHISDGLNATYKHTRWKKITKKLTEHGFANFKRLVGGFPTDFDLDRIKSDPYGTEKFGEGDLRILCQLVTK